MNPSFVPLCLPVAPVGDSGGKGRFTLAELAPLAPWRQQPELRVGGSQQRVGYTEVQNCF